MRLSKPALEIIFSIRCIQKSTPFFSMPGFTNGSLATTGSSAEDFRMPFTTSGETMRFPCGGCWIYAAIPHGLRTNFGQYRRSGQSLRRSPSGYSARSAVDSSERNRFAEGNHAGMVNSTVGAPCGMAGDVSIFPNAVAVGVPA